MCVCSNNVLGPISSAFHEPSRPLHFSIDTHLENPLNTQVVSMVWLISVESCVFWTGIKGLKVFHT